MQVALEKGGGQDGEEPPAAATQRLQKALSRRKNGAVQKESQRPQGRWPMDRPRLEEERDTGNCEAQSYWIFIQ
jgi:hypothetical protein